MKSSICLLFIIPICVSASGINKEIIGGKKSPIAYYPYLGHLETIRFICGASIIGDFWLMTSGYCKHWHLNSNDWEAVVGTQRLDFHGSRHKVTRWVQHPNYNSANQDYDFALIKVGTSMLGEKLVTRSLQLPKQNEPTPNIGDAFVCGFGQVYPEIKEMSNKFHVAILKTFPEFQCEDNLGSKYTPRKLCAREYRGIVSVSENDVGGPLVMNNTLFGVIQPSNNNYYQDVKKVRTFSRVASVRNWIKEVTGI